MSTEYKVVKEFGNTYWYLDGCFHREDGPAIEYSDGTKAWFLEGKRHRTDGPAIEYSDGTKDWYLEGKYLRENEFIAQTKKDHNCLDGKVLEIDGKKYKLIIIKNC